MSDSYLCFLYELIDGDRTIIAVCNRDSLGRIYSALEEVLEMNSQKELLQKYPYERVDSDEFSYDHKSNTVMYEGVAYQRNPESIEVNSENTRIEIN